MQHDVRENETKQTGLPSEDGVCGICFTGIHPVDNPRGRLNSCNHLFCAYCISEWAQSTNVCPHCKARFTRIFVLNKNGREDIKKVPRRNYKRWEEDEGDEDEDGDDESSAETPNSVLITCDVCGHGDNALCMIFCDRRQCQYTVHLDCINLTERPAEFFCSRCSQLRGNVAAATTTATATSDDSRRGDNMQVSEAENVCPAVETLPDAVPPCKTQFHKVSVSLPVFLRQAMERGVRGQTTIHQQQQEQEYQEADPICLSSSATPGGFPSMCSSASQNGGRRGDQGVDVGHEDDNIIRSSQTALEEYLKRQDSRNHHTRLREQRRGEVPHCRDIHMRGVGVAGVQSSLKRPRSNNTTSANHMNGNNLLHPITRQREEERLARQLAIEILPIIRRNQQVQESQLRVGRNGDITVTSVTNELEATLRERELYVRAMTEARRMAQQQIEAKVVKIRMKMERYVRVQAQREAAALAKLAKIVASHRVAAKPI